jgi:hypothetical protein
MERKDYPRSAPGHARRVQDEARIEAEESPLHGDKPVEAIDGMASSRFDADDIQPEYRGLFERTEWETKTSGIVMEKVGELNSQDPKIGHAIIPAPAASIEDWERTASATDADYDKQRLVDHGRQLVMASVREKREARRKYHREQLLAALKS